MMLNKILKLLIIILFVYAIIVLFDYIGIRDMILKQIYPKRYETYVEKYSNESELDSLLIYAIIKAESNFKIGVKSNSGAIGLMQIMESTAEEIANENNINIDNLHEPELNIQLGILYFRKLINRYDGNMVLAICAYNAGLGNVDRWILERYYCRRWSRL